jgi:hypothetical protein
MNFDAVRAYLSKRPAAFEDFPFGPEVYVYKVGAKTCSTARSRAARSNG